MVHKALEAVEPSWKGVKTEGEGEGVTRGAVLWGEVAATLPGSRDGVEGC